MARKWLILFHAVQSILKSRGSRGYRRAIALALCAMLGLGGALSLPGVTAQPPVPTDVTTVAPNSRAVVASAIALVQRARELYDAGNFSEAAGLWQQAAAEYSTTGDWLNEAMALSNLSLTYQQLGEWDKAEAAIAQSLEQLPNPSHSQAAVDERRILAESLDIYGKLQLERGRSGDAIATWKRAAALYQMLGNSQKQRQSLINQAEALQGLGLYPRACDTVLQAFGEKPDCQIFLEDDRASGEVITRLEGQSPSLIAATGLRSLGDILRQIGSLDRSKEVLERSQKMAEALSSPENMSAALLSLGNTEKAIVNRDLNEGNVQGVRPSEEPPISLPAGNIPPPEPPEKIVFKKFERSLQSYQEAIARSPHNPLTRIEAQIAQVSLLLEIQQFLWNQTRFSGVAVKAEAIAVERQIDERIKAVIPERLQVELNQLPLTVKSVSAKIKWADSLQNIANREGLDGGITCANETSPWVTQATEILKGAIADATAIGNPRLQSYANGSLAKLYERQALICKNGENRQFWLSQAQERTERALGFLTVYDAAQTTDNNSGDRQLSYADDRDMVYRWQWQLGRILNERGKPQDAKKLYRQTFQNLSNLRRDLAAIDRNVQFSFQEEVEPFYREFAQLLLAENSTSEGNSSENLAETIKVIDALQLAELENFLQTPCFVSEQETILEYFQSHSKGAEDSAIVYTLVSEIEPGELRLNLLSFTKTSDRPIYRYKDISENELQTRLFELEKSLKTEALSCVNVRATPEEREECLNSNLSKLNSHLNYFHQLLIEPIEGDIGAVKTLVFVLDPKLQNIPLNALYDGQQYLLEKHIVTLLTPALQLSDDRPLSAYQPLKVLAAGLSESQNEGDIPQVKAELEKIQEAIPNTKTLLDPEFTKPKLQQALNSSFPIVHLATHGQFSSNPKETWILAWDDRKITVNELNQLLGLANNSGGSRNNIKLLVLSACETAEGDDRAILGLAGVALRAGASSTIATLWSVEDESTATVMGNFYQHLAQGVNKSEALRSAQVALLANQKYEHPVYWAPYVLVGNWR